MPNPYLQPKLYTDGDDYIQCDMRGIVDLGNGHVRFPVDHLALFALAAAICNRLNQLRK